jgi:hypothetical protein
MSVGLVSLSLSLAKGQRITDSPPTPQSHPNSTTPNAANHSTTTNQPLPTKKQPTKFKKLPKHQTNQAKQTPLAISRMRMAKDSKYIDRIDKFAILQYANLL